MQGREAGLAELGQAKREHASRKVDVAVLQAHRLGQAHAGHSDQPEQSVIGPSAKPILRRQGQRRREQRIDLGVAVHVGLGPLQAGKHISRRHLCSWIEIGDMTRKAPHVA